MNNDSEYTLDYSPSAVQHLGVGLYKQLPQAMAELITNSWDADASLAEIYIDYTKRRITIEDNGNGMSHSEMNEKFLKVARNRRNSSDGSSNLSPNGRKVTGKKGLGKLALFGIANTIDIESVQNNVKNSFSMSFTDIKNTADDQKYHPNSLISNEKADGISNYTKITISDLTVKKITEISKLYDSLAKRFDKFSADFLVVISDDKDNRFTLKEDAFEKSIKPKNIEFTYTFPDDFTAELSTSNSLRELENKSISGKVFTGKTPLKQSETGFAVLSRGKLASNQSPTQFGERSNDYFNSYACGYFDIDFIDDDLSNDYISTDRQSILWDATDDLVQLRSNLNDLINIIQSKWRKNRTERKKEKATNNIRNAGTAQKVIASKNLTQYDKRKIEDFANLLEDDNATIPEKTKKSLLDAVARTTSTYTIDNSVYKELIPTNFDVPESVSPKIRRLREEAIKAATTKDDPDKYILTQGLLLRAILECTTTAILIKYRNEYPKKGKIFTNDMPTNQSVAKIPFGKKYTAMLKLLREEGMLTRGDHDVELEISKFNDAKINDRLNALMHDPDKWLNFDDLKVIWDTVSPNLRAAFTLF